jgi:hypothetical protein
MTSLIVFAFRLVTGVVTLFVTWFVLDKIHDRNTEIIVSSIGLLYSFIFMVSRRFQYFGLTIFSSFGRTRSFVQDLPYDRLLHDDLAESSGGNHTYLNVVFASLIELLCLFRLFTSLMNQGWDTLSEPLRRILSSAPF